MNTGTLFIENLSYMDYEDVQSNQRTSQRFICITVPASSAEESTYELNIIEDDNL